MKKLFFIWLMLELSFSQAIAQNILPPAYEIKTDTAANITLDNAYWQMLEDPEGKWTIDEVSQSPLADKFHANTTKTKGFDYSINTFWLRYHFKNSMGHDARITIPKDVSSVDLHSRGSDGKWNLKTTGTTVPWSKRDDLKRITSVTYRIQPGEELLIYERDSFNYAINYELEFLEINFGYTDKIIQDYYNDTDPSVLPSFLFGFFLLAALFNIYFFVVVRERVYLFLSLVILGRGLPLFLDNIVFLPEHPMVKWYAVVVPFWMSYFFFLVHFTRYFLQTFKYVPRWDKFLVGLSIYVIIINILGAMNIIGGEPYHAIIIVFIFITFTLFIRSNNKSVRWRAVMVLPAFCLLETSLFDPLFSLLKKYIGIQKPALVSWLSNRFTNLEELSLVWLTLFFSWSLFQRYQQLQKTIAQEAIEKERTAKEKEIERSQFIAQRSELEMQALRAQMNPHFIFNSLNSINRFILKKQSLEASEYLTKFSKLIRMILNSSSSAVVNLAEDLEALQLYLELERLRCDEKFNFKIKPDPGLDIDFIQVPPMLLQPFVENAIWHGLMSKESNGHLWININQEDSNIICTITDDGIGRKKATELKNKSGIKHKSMGMKITESRIAMMQKMNDDGKSIEIRDLVDADGTAAGTEVVLRIPVYAMKKDN